MKEISSTEELLKAIEVLEAENALRAAQLKVEFGLTLDKFSPALAVTKTISDVASSNYFKGDFLGTAFGVLSGWLTRKLFIRGSPNSIRNLIGIAVQFGITNLAANNFGIVKTVAKTLFHNTKKENVNKSDLSDRE